MAKIAAATQSKPSSNTPLVPVPCDPRTEMLWHLSKAGYDCNPRIAERMFELFVLLTAPTAPTPTEGD